MAVTCITKSTLHITTRINNSGSDPYQAYQLSIQKVINEDTWHHAIKGDGPLANEVLTNGVMIPNQEAHQCDFWHVHSENQGLFPHGVEP